MNTMEKKERNKILIALAVVAALVVAVVLYFRFMPAWASLQVLLSGVAGLVLGFMFRWLYDKYLSGIFPLLWKLVKNLFKGGKDED